MTENRKLKVFLCHSRDDKPKVRRLYHRLVSDGFDAWLDEEKLIPGQDWDLEIRRAVREADVVVVCLSKSSTTKSGYVQKEIQFALDVADEQLEGTIFIIPARLDDYSLPNRLHKWQRVDLFEERGYKQLKTSLELRGKELGIVLYLPFDFVPQLLKIPAGKFLMGSTKEQAQEAVKEGTDKNWVECEQPQHEVELSEYFIGKYPITNHEYQAFVHEASARSPQGWDGGNYSAEKSDHPVVNVSWNDAQNYCKWLSVKTGKTYRLPTEAEWEKAARGEKGLIYPWGDEFDSKKCNTVEAKIGDTTPVGHFSQAGGDSRYGCVDMVGNIWEWCNDWFHEKEYKNRFGKMLKNPQGPPRGGYRVLRGGSFNHNLRYARCTYRTRHDPDLFNYYRGFRVMVSTIIKSEL